MSDQLDIGKLRVLIKLCWPALPWTHDKVEMADEDGCEAVCQMMNNAHALLDAAEERDRLKADVADVRHRWDLCYSTLSLCTEERDALRAEVANVKGHLECTILRESKVHAMHADECRENERLREALKLAEAQEQGCGGTLSDSEALRATLQVIRSALRPTREGEVKP